MQENRVQNFIVKNVCVKKFTKNCQRILVLKIFVLKIQKILVLKNNPPEFLSKNCLSKIV